MPETIPQLENLGGTIPSLLVDPPQPRNYESGSTSSNQDPLQNLYAFAQNLKTTGKGTVPISSFAYGDRYNKVVPFTDPEEAYAKNQSALDKLGNGLAKMAGKTGTSFVSGTLGLLNGIGNLVIEGRFSSLFDNETTRLMDAADKALENALPNYYTQQEKDATWYSTDNLLTMNFVADKLLKNLGYSIGSMAGGFAWGSILKNVGLINKLTQTGKGLAAIEATEAALTSLPKAQHYKAVSSIFQKLAQNVASPILKDSERILTSTLGTFGEASMEAQQNMNEVRNNMISDFKAKNGRMPNDVELSNINAYAEKTGNITWGLNTLLLTGTNYIALPKILGSSRKLEAAGLNNIIEEPAELGVKWASEKLNRFQKLGKAASHFFAPSEAFEEGMQFAIQTGTSDYFKRAYENREGVNDFWNSLIGATKNVFSHGIEQSLSTKEGLESILIGGISGGIQQMGVVGMKENEQGKIRPTMFGTGTIGEQGFFGEGGQRAKNTQTAVDVLNNSNFKGQLKDFVEYTNRAVNSQQLRQEAIKNGDVLNEKDFERDFALSTIMPRVKYGKEESLYSEIEGYIQQASNPEGFSELQASGIALQNENAGQFIQRLNGVKSLTKSVEKNYEQIKDKYANIYEKVDGKNVRKYSDNHIDKLVYSMSKIQDYDTRIPQLSETLLSKGIDVQSILDDELTNDNPSKLQEELKKINALEDINKDSLKENLQDVVELSKRRKQFFNEYEAIKNNPDRFYEPEEVDNTKPVVIEQYSEPKDKKSPVQTKELELGKEYSLLSPIIVSGDKIITNPKISVTSQTLGSEYETILPSGEKTFLTSQQFKEYNITATEHKPETVKKITEEVIKELADTEKYKDVITTPTLDFVNSLGNKTLLNTIVDKVNEKYDELVVAVEKIAKQREELERQQKEIEKKSGTVATGNPENENIEPETAKKTAAKFFKSSVTESEDWNNPDESAKHIVNAREFLLNAKNFSNRDALRAILVTPNSENKLGLVGLTNLSYGTMDQSESTDVEKGFVAQVFVEQDGNKLFFVNKEGKRIGEVGKQIDNIDDVIFQTMPTTELYYSFVDTKTGERIARYRKEEKEEFELEAKRWKAQRELLFKQDGSKLESYEFIISRGLPVMSEDGSKSHVENILKIPNKLIVRQQDLVQISTSGFITHNGQNIGFPKGRPVLQYGDTLQALDNTKITPTEAITLYHCILEITNNIVNATKEGKRFNINSLKETSFIQNILFWGKGQKSDNQIYIDGSNLHIGKTSFPITEIADKESEIREAITGIYRNVNNTTLKDISVPFYELKFNGKELEPIQWKSYQEYLLSSKNPDNSKRSTDATPLVTGVTSYKQKYATLEQIEYPQVATPVKQESKTETPKTENVISIMGESIPFTYTEENGNFTVEINASEATKRLAENNELVNKYSTTLKSINLPVSDNSEQVIIDFLSLQKAAQLKKASQEKEVVKPTEEVKVKEQPNVSDIEAKKADIEKRRQEELKKSEVISGKKGDVVYDIKGQEYTINSVSKEGRPIKITDNVFGATVQGEVYTKNLKEINAKYDAELSALESQVNNTESLTLEQELAKAEEAWAANVDEKGYPKEALGPILEKIKAKYNTKNEKTAPLDIKKIKRRDAEYMRVGEELTSATPEQSEKFKKWHKENVPNIPFEVLENLVDTFDGEKAFGVFENGVAKFYKGAPGTTAYHEAFEGIWKHFLTLDEKNAIIQELRNTIADFKDRASGKTLNYATATDEQIKERIADDFAEFKAGKIPAKSLLSKIVEFFRNIMSFFKSFVQKPTLKESLFKEIEKGRFKESKITSPDSTPEYSRVPGLTETQVYELTQDMTSLASFYLFGVDSKKSLYDIAKVTSKELFDWIKEEYIKQDLYEQLGDKRWNQLVNYTKDNLKTIGVSFKKNEDKVDEETIDINTEGANKNDYDSNPFKQDWKKNSPYAVKLSLMVPKTVYTNQENKSTLEIPERQLTSYQGYKLANFNKLFVNLMNKLSNTTSVDKFINKFFTLAKTESDLVVPLKRLGVNLDGSIDFSKFQKDDWRLFVDYFKVFTKQNPNAVIQYTDNGSTYIAPANQFTASKAIEAEWFENMKSKGNKIVKKDKEKKTYTVDLKDISFPKTIEQTLDFLDELGVIFPMDIYNRLSKKDQSKVLKAGGNIYTYIQSNPNVATLDGKLLGINGPLNTLSNILVNTTNPNIDSTHFNVEGERVGSYTENNYPSEFENLFNESKTLDELLEAMPQLKDVYANNSQLLKKGGLFFDEDGNRIATIKVGTTGGVKNLNSDKGTPISKLTLGNRFIQEINNNLQGNYYVLIPADGSTEWMLNLGNVISFDDVREGRATKQINDIFISYLKDEIQLALQDRSFIANIGNKAQQLRFFREILSEKDVKKIEDIISSKITLGEKNTLLNEYIKENSDSIKESIQTYIKSSVKDLQTTLETNQQIKRAADNTYSIPNILSEFLSSNKLSQGEISETELNNILTFVQANYIIANTEFHKVLFGDPYQFKDETKRIKSFLSPRRRTFDMPAFNNFLNTEYNKAGEIELDENEFGYHTHKSYTNTSTLSDINVVGSVAMMENMPKSIRDAYSKTNEADAASLILDNTYREVKLKNQQWSDRAEKWHQWHLAFARQNMPGYVYTNKELAEQDKKLISTPEPDFIADVIKPIVSGIKHNQGFINLDLDKMSQMPLYYKWVQGTNLEKLYLQMHKENKGYVVMISGRKVGSEGQHSIYNSNGSFNTEGFNNNIQIPWTAYGIQQENAFEKPKDQTRGSQPVKLVTVDLYENGKPIGTTPERQEVIRKANERYNGILNEHHQALYNQLISKLGVEDMGDSFKLVNPAVISETLANELLRREMNRNDKETIQLDENGEFKIPFEASPAYFKIKSILYSLVNKALISPKLNGAPHVQAPVTGWEGGTRKLAIKTDSGYKRVTQKEYNSLSDEQKKKVVLTDDTLKFYENEDGKRHCEVMLPHWFREKLGKHANKTDEELIKYLNNHPDGKKILMGIGFRIPTQSISSIEVFKVKGFLPKSMGYTVIVPSEITTKAGSDFDIDKLNTYLKSIYIDENGDIQLVKYINNEQETKDFYKKVYESTIQKDIDKLSKFDEFRDQLFNIFSQLESLEDFTLDSIRTALSEEDFDFYNQHTDILQEIINQAAEEDINPSVYINEQIERLGVSKEKLTAKLLNDSLKEKYVNDMYRKAIENEYYSSMEELLTLPEVFERMLTPVGDAGLKDLATSISKLRNENEDSIKTKMLNRDYLTKLRHAFVTGKRWVGIAATNITAHAIFQKSDVYIDPSKFIEQSKRDQFFLGDGSIILPHNKNEQGLPSLSGVYTEDKSTTISERLSGYATAAVDIAKDPFVMTLFKSDRHFSLGLFLERLGCGETGVKFLQQPIITEYLKYLDATDQKGLFNKQSILYIKSLFPTTDKSLEKAEINLKNLESNIEEYYEEGYFHPKSDLANAEQHLIFAEFLKYAKMAEFNFKITQAINYDTTRFGSGDALTRKQIKTEQAKKNIISNVDEILNNTFLKTQSELLDKSMNAMGPILKLEERSIRDITDEILRPYAEREFMADDDFDKISNKIKLSFLDFLIQTKTGINNDIAKLLLNETGNIQEQLETAKKKYPQLQILKDFVIESSKLIGGAKTIKLKVNAKEAFEEDNYIAMMEELKEIEPELYNSIIKTSILQGTAQTSVSISNIVPVEDRAKIISPIINTLAATPDVQAFSKGAFQRSNWKDDSIVPMIDMFNAREIDNPDPWIDQYGNEIAAYEIFDIPKFNNKKSDIVYLSEYNALQSGDFIKIPRVVTAKTKEGNVKVNVITGRQVTDADIRRMAATGNFSFKDVIGYQLVRDITGSPVTITQFGQDGTEYTKYVYKKINLYGDGKFTTEYRLDNSPSQINNGTIKTQEEIPDNVIIQHFGGIANKQKKQKQDNIPEQKKQTSISPSVDILDLRKNKINYTQGQTKALKDVAKLISRSGNNYYLLAGYAGTGKTTIAENIAKYAKELKKGILVIAPTNKAAKVLNDKLKSTGVESVASTIHKTIYGSPNEFGEWERSNSITNSVIIIDESSMIEKSVMKDLIDSTKDKNNTLVFMGDSYQLQPVGEDPGLFQNKVTEVKDNKTELTEVKRQALDSTVLKIATAIRNDKKLYIPKESTNDFKVVSSKNEFVENFKQAIKNQEDVAMIVATNNERMLMNKIARQVKFGTDANNILNNNETIISIANSTDYSNSEIFDVKELKGEPTKFNLTFTDNFGKTSKYDVYLSFIVNDKGIEIPTLFIPNIDKPSIYHAQILKAARESNKELYDALEGWILFTKKGEKLSPAILIATYGYAITAHKSQGSQWKKVFVNQNYVADSWDAARWFYTAITRASDNVEVLSSSLYTGISNDELNNKTQSSTEQNKVVSLPSMQMQSNTIYSQLGNKTQSENVIIDEINGRKPAVESKVDLNTFTNYSGAAQGGDTVWENVGKEFGLGKQVNYRPEDLQKLTKEQLQEVENAYQQAVKDLGRKPLDANTFAGGLVRRDYLQAKAANAVFAISTVVQPNEKDPKGYINKTNKPLVAGGTGYAVQMAINLGKPVYVFDQVKNKWSVWSNNDFVETTTPTLTKKFAGIGTREINENGKQAIRKVYEKSTQSFKPIVAYRTRGNNFLEALEKDNAIGNPWSHAGYSLYKTNTVKEAVEEFIAWMIGEKHIDKLQDYRQAIIDKILEMRGKQILYYKDLGRPSHATALDYLINKYDWSKEDQTKTITLKDNKSYDVNTVNSKMLEQMGYTPEEIGKILKQIC